MLRSASTGKMAPIDAQPTPVGNIVIENGCYRVLRDGVDTPGPENWPLFTSHFATCPQSRDWRSGKRGR
jgi:hypothetical protein